MFLRISKQYFKLKELLLSLRVAVMKYQKKYLVMLHKVTDNQPQKF